jgi:hypothetical protein
MYIDSKNSNKFRDASNRESLEICHTVDQHCRFLRVTEETQFNNSANGIVTYNSEKGWKT